MPPALSDDGAPSASLGHLRVRPLRRTPERRRSISEARRGLRSPPRAAPKMRTFPQRVNRQVATQLQKQREQIETDAAAASAK